MNAGEIRACILASVAQNGGHLASSLGAVELAQALAETFDPEKDRIVWDVGHQAYAWKILTGRADRFGTLRRMGGLSGVPNPAESRADAAIAGHAGVALSVAEGFAAARDLKASDEHVVAVIGDSSFVNGTCFEALNNCTSSCSKVIVVLNDNEMSISKPTGAFSRYLGRLIAGRGYNRVKETVKRISRALRIYEPAHRIKAFFKRMLLGRVYFEEMGLRYIGPVDGHDLKALKTALAVAKENDRSVLLHVVTKKGRGFAPAEKDPTYWHGVGPFDLRSGAPSLRPPGPPAPSDRSWSDVFGAALCEQAASDPRIVALTAGMKDGTGLADFAARFPRRFHDVGIAEGHMVAFAAGLAAGGSRPVVAVYSTFLQRAVDQIMHDVCISNLPVVFCVDRAGVVGADGVTHQGLYDLAMLRCLPNLTICQPKDAEDLRLLLAEALRRNGPTLIRYPRGKAPESLPSSLFPLPSSPVPPRLAIWATGDWYAKACEVAERTGGLAVHARYLKPFDAQLLAGQRARGMKIVSLENGAVSGGLGEALGADLKFGWPDVFIPHGPPDALARAYGLDADSLVAALKRTLNAER